MIFKKASTSYAGADRTYNPLWKHISNRWYEWLNKGVGSQEFRSDLYVSRRMEAGAVEQDVLDRVLSEGNKLCIVRGPAGVGKTTFLSKAREIHLQKGPYAVVRYDGLIKPISVEDELLEFVSGELQRRIERSAHADSWPMFWLKHCNDPAGTAALQRLLALDPLPAEALFQLDQRAVRLSSRDPLEWCRLQLTFVRAVLQLTPVVIIDNVDQFPTALLQKMQRVASTLAIAEQGELEDDPIRKVVAYQGVAKVFMAMRPATMVETRPQFQLQHLLRVTPPDLAEVLKRRMEAFLEEYRGPEVGKVVKADITREAIRQAPDLAALLAEHAPEPEVCRVVLETVLSALLQNGSATNLCWLLYKATNYNLRLSLLSAARFAMSGHLSFREVSQALHGRVHLSEYKAFRALLLGFHSLYRENENGQWALNLLSDGQPDETSVLVRLRLLKYVALEGAGDGVSPDQAISFAGDMFGYEEARVRTAWDKFVGFGLIHEHADQRFQITECGTTYLSALFRNFEYLQHVAVEVFVPVQVLVPCHSSQEDPPTRFKRVLRIAEWLRECELNTMIRLHKDAKWPRFFRVFGDDLVCQTMARTLAEVAPRLPRMGNEDFVGKAKAFAARTTFAALSEEAGITSARTGP